MLDRSQLCAQLERVSSSLFLDYSEEYAIVCQVWDQVSQDPLFKHKIQVTSLDVVTPSWDDQLSQVIPVSSSQLEYRAVAVDGSQIYPDKHQGTNCYLINVGSIVIAYGLQTERPFVCANKPTIFIGDEESDLFNLTPEVVNCRRQEYEFQELLNQHKIYGSDNTVYLFDGSLIFWHLDSKDLQLKHTFLTCYLAQLHQMYERKMIIAGYISLPKSKDLINLMRVAIHEGMVTGIDRGATVNHMVDSSLVSYYLRSYTRTILFKHNSVLSASYPEHIRPYFFYIDVGDEIARVEIPAWVAHDAAAVERVASVILDQSLKGRGYPVALAEAHEQAVVKGADRDFFYHLIAKIGIEQKKRIVISQKSLKKRGIGV